MTGLKDYIKGAFLIRKSWKQYKRSYEKILKIGGAFLGNSREHEHNPLCESNSTKTCNVGATPESGNVSLYNCNRPTKPVASHGLQEVQAAIAFGYGLFNLVVSLTPPKVLHLAQLFGFTGDQELGLSCLKYVSYSQNVKAELSR